MQTIMHSHFIHICANRSCRSSSSPRYAKFSDWPNQFNFGWLELPRRVQVSIACLHDRCFNVLLFSLVFASTDKTTNFELLFLGFSWSRVYRKGLSTTLIALRFCQRLTRGIFLLIKPQRRFSSAHSTGHCGLVKLQTTPLRSTETKSSMHYSQQERNAKLI